MIRGVILDVDGTLVLSNDAHARAWVEAFAAHGYDVPFERVRSLIGMGGDKLLPQVVPGLSDETNPGKAIAERRKQIFQEQYAADLAPANGSHALVAEFKRRGLRYVVASSAKRDELQRLLEAAQVADLIDQTTTSDDAEESKPAPDVVGVALDRIGLAPAEVVMIGDTPYDVESAQGCDIGTIGLRCGGFADADLGGALAIYNDPADLLAQFDQSPLAAT